MSALFGPKKWFERTDLFVRQLTKTTGSKMRDMPRKSTQMLISKAKTTTIEFNCVSKILDITRIIVQICIKKARHRSSSCLAFLIQTCGHFGPFLTIFYRPVYDFYPHVVKSPMLGNRGDPPLLKNRVSACCEASAFYMLSALQKCDGIDG